MKCWGVRLPNLYLKHITNIMHILKIIHGYPPNYNAGSEVYSQSVCNELSKHHKISVFTREENPYKPCFAIRHVKEHKNLNLYYANNPQGKDGYRHEELDENFAALITEIKPDVAHIGHLNHLSTGIVDELKKQGIPIVFTLHDFWLMCPRGQFLTRSIGKENNFQLCTHQENTKCATNCYSVYFSGREQNLQDDINHWSSWVGARMDETRAIAKKVDLFIAPSRYLKDRFVKDFDIPVNKIEYLDYGFPTHYLTPTNNIQNREVFTFGYIGTHITAKGVNLLIEAFKKIEAPSKLLIWGHKDDQSSNALRKLAEGSVNTIEFVGQYVNKNLANEVFTKVDCIVVSSIWTENSPLVIHEAQACNIPVITADAGGMQEYVQHEVNGLLFKHRDVDSLQEQMLHAINNQDMVKQLGKRGYLHDPNGKVPDITDHCVELVSLYNQVTATRDFWRITIDTNPEDCNMHCIMCEEHSPYSDFIPKLYKETGVKRRRMKFQTVEEILHQAEQLRVKEIIPSTMGEPLLYKEFDQIFELAAEKNIKINLTTNGSFPKKTVLEWAKLIVPNTTDIKISWNGATEEVAKKVMIGIDFNQTVENVKELIKYRDAYHAETGYFCRVTFQLTFMQNNMHELADIIKLAASLNVDRVKGHQLWDHFDEIKELSMKANTDSIIQWNKYVELAYEAQEYYRKPNGEKVLLENITPISENKNNEVPEHYECPFLSKELWISATGKISPCCAPDNLRSSLGDFGNINDTTIENVLKSSKYMDLVENYKSKTLCKSCNMRKAH
jgi:glycosyltransferase involved in cell wall biosynthesis/MoaA/NifB/PqqE/SkfB family radical SAM enzyme